MTKFDSYGGASSDPSFNESHVDPLVEVLVEHYVDMLTHVPYDARCKLLMQAKLSGLREAIVLATGLDSQTVQDNAESAALSQRMISYPERYLDMTHAGREQINRQGNESRLLLLEG